jgi:hypothetical protein
VGEEKFWVMPSGAEKEATPMAKSPKLKRKQLAKTVFQLPDLEQSGSVVLNSSVFASFQLSYDQRDS